LKDSVRPLSVLQAVNNAKLIYKKSQKGKWSRGKSKKTIVLPKKENPQNGEKKVDPLLSSPQFLRRFASGFIEVGSLS